MWLLVKNLWICSSNLVFSCDILLQNGLWFHNCNKFLSSSAFHSWTSQLETPLTINVSCFVQWLNYIFRLHHNSFCNNCPHINSIDNWLVRVLSETTRVWKDNGKVIKNMNAKFSLEFDDQCLLIDCNHLNLVNMSLHWGAFLHLKIVKLLM